MRVIGSLFFFSSTDCSCKVNTLVSLLLVVMFVVGSAVIGGAFATQVVMESYEFSAHLAMSVQDSLGNAEKVRGIFVFFWLFGHVTTDL